MSTMRATCALFSPVAMRAFFHAVLAREGLPGADGEARNEADAASLVHLTFTY
jgi:hypothetical protein